MAILVITSLFMSGDLYLKDSREGDLWAKGHAILNFNVTAKFCTFLSGFQPCLYNGDHIL